MIVYQAEEFHRYWTEAFNAGNHAELLDFYEDEAVLVTPAESVQGKERIGLNLDGLLALHGHMELSPEMVINGDGLALLISSWSLQAASPDGQPVSLSGRTADVIRRQADDSWLVAIDNPGSTQDQNQTG